MTTVTRWLPNVILHPIELMGCLFNIFSQQICTRLLHINVCHRLDGTSAFILPMFPAHLQVSALLWDYKNIS